MDDPVLAIGSRDSASRFYMHGTVSGLATLDLEMGEFKVIRSLGEGKYANAFYLGGPLINSKGYVIGVNTFKDYDYFDDIYYYFAISSDYFIDVLAQYRDKKFSEIAVESFSDLP